MDRSGYAGRRRSAAASMRTTRAARDDRNELAADSPGPDPTDGEQTQRTFPPPTNAISVRADRNATANSAGLSMSEWAS